MACKEYIELLGSLREDSTKEIPKDYLEHAMLCSNCNQDLKQLQNYRKDEELFEDQMNTFVNEIQNSTFDIKQFKEKLNKKIEKTFIENKNIITEEKRSSKNNSKNKLFLFAPVAAILLFALLIGIYQVSHKIKDSTQVAMLDKNIIESQKNHERLDIEENKVKIKTKKTTLTRRKKRIVRKFSHKPQPENIQEEKNESLNSSKKTEKTSTSESSIKKREVPPNMFSSLNFKIKKNDTSKEIESLWRKLKKNPKDEVSYKKLKSLLKKKNDKKELKKLEELVHPSN